MTLCVTQAAPGVRRLSNVYTNWYLLEAGGRLTVLDAGLPGDWREFLSALSRLGHSPDDIDAVLITQPNQRRARSRRCGDIPRRLCSTSSALTLRRKAP
jgi:hypothetical protein